MVPLLRYMRYDINFIQCDFSALSGANYERLFNTPIAAKEVDEGSAKECVGSGLEGAPAPPFTQLISQDLI